MKTSTFKILFFCSLLIFNVNSNAFFWNSIIEVSCFDSNNSVSLEYRYELKDKDVLETIIIPKNRAKVAGKDVLVDLKKLEDCVVKDSKNWVCGGKISSYLPVGEWKIVNWISERHASLDGKYSFIPAMKDSVSLGDIYCKKRIQSN